MCFHSDTPILLIAKKNIVCYKLLSAYQVSPYQNFVYRKNQKNDDMQLILRSNIINIGYHSYKKFKTSYIRSTRDWGISQSGPTRLKVFKFVIPKGAEYYENNREYVSSNIILKNECKFKSFFGKIFYV